MPQRFASLLVILAALTAWTVQPTAAQEQPAPEKPSDDRPAADRHAADRPLDAGAYLTIAYAPMLMDTQRLAYKIEGAPPFRFVTPGSTVELHFFARSAAILGFSSTYWANDSHGDDMRTDLWGWDVLFNVGVPVAEYRDGSLAILVGVGYAENHLRFDGDFATLRLSDPDLPSGDDSADLTQRGALFAFALRADLRDAFSCKKTVKPLVISGLSVGYKGGDWWTNWRRGGHRVSNIPTPTQDVFFAQIHVGFGGGVSWSDTPPEP